MLTTFLQEIALQLNSTYHKAIKAIPYEVVYNRKPNYHHAPIGLRQITIDQVEEQEIDDEMDTSLIYDAVAQEAMEDRVGLQLAASDPDHQEHFSNRLIDDSNRMLEEEEAAAREAIPPTTTDPITPPNHRQEEGLLVDPDLLSPHLDRLRIEQQEAQTLEPQELDSTPTTLKLTYSTNDFYHFINGARDYYILHIGFSINLYFIHFLSFF